MIRRSVLLGLLIQTAGAPLALAPQRPVLPAGTITSIDSAVARFMGANDVPCVSVAVVTGGVYAWSEGFGMADMETFVPVTPQTLIRLASVSKPSTAIGALELREAGKLHLDAPVQRYCAEFPTKPWPVTTREVPGHLGIRHYRTIRIPTRGQHTRSSRIRARAVCVLATGGSSSSRVRFSFSTRAIRSSGASCRARPAKPTPTTCVSMSLGQPG